MAFARGPLTGIVSMLVTGTQVVLYWSGEMSGVDGILWVVYQ